MQEIQEGLTVIGEEQAEIILEPRVGNFLLPPGEACRAPFSALFEAVWRAGGALGG
jgi:hypothetical protein